jgi:hypothetical protein
LFLGVDPKNIEVSLLGGEATFQNLSVKQTALDNLGLPFNLKKGSNLKFFLLHPTCASRFLIGFNFNNIFYHYTIVAFVQQAHLKLSWSNLGSEPVVLTLSGIYLLCGPRPRSAATYEDIISRQQKLKQNSLKVASLWGLDESSAQTKESSGAESSGIVDSLKLKIVQNLQLVIEDVHLRFEDETSNPNQPVAFGITLQKVRFATFGDVARRSWCFANFLVVCGIVPH